MELFSRNGEKEKFLINAFEYVIYIYIYIYIWIAYSMLVDSYLLIYLIYILN